MPLHSNLILMAVQVFYLDQIFTKGGQTCVLAQFFISCVVLRSKESFNCDLFKVSVGALVQCSGASQQ